VESSRALGGIPAAMVIMATMHVVGGRVPMLGIDGLGTNT
jgi:hypothetical protein